jgi:hypothetical protein
MTYRHSLIRALVLHYLDHFGYAGPPVRVFTTPTRSHRADPEHEEGAKRYLGWCRRSARQTIVYVNAAKHDTLGDLLDTCAHEAHHACGQPDHKPSLMVFEGEVAEAVLA